MRTRVRPVTAWLVLKPRSAPENLIMSPSGNRGCQRARRHRRFPHRLYGANQDSVAVGVRTAGHTGDVDRQAITSPAGRSTPPKAAVSLATPGPPPGFAGLFSAVPARA